MPIYMGGKTRIAIAAGVFALIAAAPAALALPADPPAPPPPPPHMEHGPMDHEMGPPRIDLNGDGYISRDEARAAAEKMFEHLDTNDDGKLDAADHPMHRPPGDRREREERFEERSDDGNGKIIRRVEIRREDGDDDHHGRHMMRHPGMPPMGMMLLMSREEADLNHDGALSKDEFVNQQMRFFDAADVNGDGRIKFDMPKPPEGPEPPIPPAPAQPPRR